MSNAKDNNSSDKITNAFNQLNFIDCQKSANMNDPDGIFWLGYCYEYGIGVGKDKNKAFIQYQKSADMNNPNGMCHVGHCYYLGIGVEMDKYKAFIYYLKSAEAGNSIGIFKTAICYKYGIGVEENHSKYEHWIDKDSDYGKCTHCNKYNTSKAWCQTCDPDITIHGWTSGNKDIDNCIKGFQLRANTYEHMIEWIPFDRLEYIRKIGMGNFSIVFSATWLDGTRKIDVKQGIQKIFYGKKYMRSRKSSRTVALKTFPAVKENPYDFLKEFENYVKCRLVGGKLKIYGLTQNTKTNEYFMVLQYADNGNLHEFLRKIFKDLTWYIKLKLLLDISDDLRHIHHAGYSHRDFRSGNVLQYEGISKSIKSCISDLGLSINIDDSKGIIYGVLPYIAPEVFEGQNFTQAADIYSFGVIMSEMSTGQRAFDGYQYDAALQIRILFEGLRPEFAPGTPDCYIELAKQCMGSDPKKRPDAWDICEKLEEWNKSIEDLDDANEIKKQFLEADKIVKLFPIISST